MKKYISYIYILMAAACWGMLGLFTRILSMGGFSATDIVVVRNFGGLLMLVSIFAMSKRSVFSVRLKHLPIFFGTGVISVLFFAFCYFSCQERCSLAVAAILLYTAPAMVVVMSAILWRERITKRKLGALGLVVLGCSFVTGVWSGGLTITLSGALFGIGAAFFYALYSIFGRYGLEHYDSFTVTLWTFVFAGVGSLIWLDVPTLANGFQTPSMIAAAVGLVMIATVLPYILYTKGLSKVESGNASIIASLEPVVAALVGVIAFGEPMNIMILLGLVCILLSVYILR